MNLLPEGLCRAPNRSGYKRLQDDNSETERISEFCLRPAGECDSTSCIAFCIEKIAYKQRVNVFGIQQTIFLGNVKNVFLVNFTTNTCKGD